MSKLSEAVRKITSFVGHDPRKWTREFNGSQEYWEARYRAGGASGSGSYGRLARFKAETINAFVADEQIASVVELGCGDGHQLSLMKYPAYTGLDVSPTVVERAAKRFRRDPSKRFLVSDSTVPSPQAELSLSLDVVYHLVEQEVYELYMADLFQASTRFVIVYSSNVELPASNHLRHRRFTDWAEENVPNWHLVKQIPNRYPFDPESPDETSLADFYIYSLAAEAGG